MKIEKIITIFLYIIIFIKIIFLISAIGHLIYSHFNKTSNRSIFLDTKFSYWKERTEFIFVFLMAILLIFIFNPRYHNEKYITKEMSILFFLFGVILIITANWSLFFTESKWYKTLSNAIKL
jgi:hypothetical protein